MTKDSLVSKDTALKLAIEALELINEHAFRCGLAQDAIKACKEALSEPEKLEPFGYFKAEPFGWTDCAETDEGAIALYENPPAQYKAERKKALEHQSASEIASLKADNVIMRDALNKIALGYVYDADIIESAGDCLQRLSATPEQSMKDNV